MASEPVTPQQTAAIGPAINSIDAPSSVVNNTEMPAVNETQGQTALSVEDIMEQRQYMIELSRNHERNSRGRKLLLGFSILTHILFLYGQIVAMWQLSVVQDVDMWVNATTTASKTTFSAFGIPQNANHVVLQDSSTVKTFTYSYAIQELWQARGMPSKFMARIAAAGLVLFSGVWPHLKLILLNIVATRRNISNRGSKLTWLATLGKWSLADVLAVCVMVGVLNLNWNVDPNAVKDGLIEHMPTVLNVIHTLYSSSDLCGMILKTPCEGSGVWNKAKCSPCSKLLDEAFSHPDWARKSGKAMVQGVRSSGGGSIRLAVVGMSGIYFFGAAVILSILLSLIVDIVLQQQESSTANESATTPDISTDLDSLALEEEEQSAVSEPLIAAGDSPLEPMEVDDGTSSIRRTAAKMWNEKRSIFNMVWNSGLFGLSLFSVFVVLLAVTVPTMERRVTGAIPQLMHDVLGMNWGHSYSLLSLVKTTGSAGGWDFLLMATFGLFVVLGPVGWSMVNAAWMGGRYNVSWQHSLFAGAFCAWEVWICAMGMVYMLMPSITTTIVHSDACTEISSDGSCLEVEFNPLQSFGLVVVGWTLLLATTLGAFRKLKTGGLDNGSHYVMLTEGQNVV